MKITKEDIEKYGNYAKAYYEIYERQKRNCKKRTENQYKTSEHTREVSKKWYEENKQKIKEYNKERYKKLLERKPKREPKINISDIEYYGGYDRAYYYKIKKDNKVNAVKPVQID